MLVTRLVFQHLSASNYRHGALEILAMELVGLFPLPSVDFGSDPFICPFPKGSLYEEPGCLFNRYVRRVY